MIHSKQLITSGLLSLGLCAALGLSVYAVPEKPSGQTGGEPPSGQTAPGGAPGSSASQASYSGATTISSDTSLENTSFSSTTSAENALLISGGTVNLSGATITKSGDTSDEDSDFYGTNAAVLAYNDSTLNLSDSEVTTNAGHANGIFAYGSGTINLSKTKITTSGNNSGGVMVTGGGTLNASDLTVQTSGNSSAAIRSDRGGGTLTVNGGSYQTSGQGSPAIYSTANITTNSANLTSTASEGVVIEGSNSVTLEDTTLTDTNNTLNGNSETYKNIFIYQSMSGDASEGTGTFTAKNSQITTNQGDTFFVTNTTAIINLENNSFTNNDAGGAFLRAQAGKWGTSGSNGGDVTINASNQEILGDLVLDNISSLSLNLTAGSYYRGTINEVSTAKNLSLNLSSDSVIVLNADSYVDSLTNEDSTNSNIYLNGYNLYVADEPISGNTGTPPTGKQAKASTEADQAATAADSSTTDDATDFTPWVVFGSAALAIVLGFSGKIWYNKKQDGKSKNSPTSQSGSSLNESTSNDESLPPVPGSQS